MSDDFAMIDGKRYPIQFAGYDRDTYRHVEGCLAFLSERDACQCGASDRAKRFYVAELPPVSASGDATSSDAGEGK